MSHRLTVAAMVAAHGGLDQTLSIRIATGYELEQAVAGVLSATFRDHGYRRRMTAMARDRISHHLPQLLIRNLHRHPRDL